MIQRLQVKRNEKGFTLIELLIVIIVLGILAAIVVFAVGSTRKDSVASSCKTNYKSLELSAEAVNTKLGDYPIGKVTAGFPANAATPVANPLIAPQSGALLKSFPTSSDYSFQYVGTAGVSPAPSTFVINVFKNGVDKATPTDGNLYTTATSGAAATAATGSGVAQCEGL